MWEVLCILPHAIICIFSYIYTYIHIYKYTYIWVYISIERENNRFSHFIYICIHTYIYIYIYIHIHIYTYIYIWVYISIERENDFYNNRFSQYVLGIQWQFLSICPMYLIIEYPHISYVFNNRFSEYVLGTQGRIFSIYSMYSIIDSHNMSDLFNCTLSHVHMTDSRNISYLFHDRLSPYFKGIQRQIFSVFPMYSMIDFHNMSYAVYECHMRHTYTYVVSRIRMGVVYERHITSYRYTHKHVLCIQPHAIIYT